MQGGVMQNWSCEKIEFARDADLYCGYFKRLAALLSPYFPKDAHLCDAGCGIGGLSVAMAQRGFFVTAVDRNSAVIEELVRTAPPNVRPVCADIRTLDGVYDGMLFHYFGGTEQIVRLVRAHCRGTAIVIRRSCAEHRFSIGQTQSCHRTDDMPRVLRSIPHEKQTLSIEFGQPFRTMTEAMRFFTLYNNSTTPPEEKAVAARLIATGRDDFPLYFPQLRTMNLYVFRSDAI